MFLQAIVWLAFALLSGCGTAPPKSASPATSPAVTPRPGAAPGSERDGAEARPPADLANVPDAEPRVEPILSGGPNRPYEALGRGYVPITEDRPFTERGLASWYGKKFHGRRTASGEIYNMYAMTAAHPTLPIPSYVRVLNPANKREVVVRVNDRGPFHRGRIIDLSYTAAYKLGVLNGVAQVELTRITFEEIRNGARPKGAPSEPAPRNNEQDPADMAAAARPAASPDPAFAPAPVAAASPQVPTSTPAAPLVATATAVPSVAPAANEEAPSAAARPAPGFWVQLGAFRQREGADGFHRRVVADLGWLAPLLGVFTEPNAFRLMAGPYASRNEAQGVAQRVREALNLVPVIIERR